MVPSNPGPAQPNAPNRSQLTEDELRAAHRESKAKAEELFPELKIEGSPIQAEADRLISEYRRTNANYRLQPDYPLRIAYEASFNLAKRSYAGAPTSAPAQAASPARIQSRATPGEPGSADNPTYLIAVKANDTPKTNSDEWILEVGEVYKFIRFLSRAEYQGTSGPTNDRSYVVVRMDDVFIAESVTAFKIPDDLIAAEARYTALLEQKRREDEKWAQEIAAYYGDKVDDVRNDIRRVRKEQAGVFLGGSQR